jgi:hypothetical protein
MGKAYIRPFAETKPLNLQPPKLCLPVRSARCAQLTSLRLTANIHVAKSVSPILINICFAHNSRELNLFKFKLNQFT